MLNFRDISARRHPAIISHRGVRAEAHENTIEAFRAAIKAKADAIELDVRRTGDNEIVVFHNKLIPRIKKRISKGRYAELKEQCILKGFYPPRLEEVLLLCRGKMALDIELKEEGYEKDVVELVDRYYDPPNVVFTSFHDESVAQIKKISPEAITGLIMGPYQGVLNSMSFGARSVVARMKRCGANLAVLHASWLGKKSWPQLQASGFSILTWTVNAATMAARLIGGGAKGLITDYPDKIRPLVGNYDS